MPPTSQSQPEDELPPPTFDSSLKKQWPDSVEISYSDHAESLRLQYQELSKQAYETPYYGLWLGSVAPFLCALYSNDSSDLRLEMGPIPTLHYSVRLTRDQLERLLDPDYQPPSDDVRPSEFAFRDSLDGRASPDDNSLTGMGIAPSTRVLRRRTQPTRGDTSSSGTRPPDSQQSTASSSVSNSTSASSADSATIHGDLFTATRAPDGIFYAREKKISVRERVSKRAGDPKAIPALLVEIKVPTWSEAEKDAQEFMIGDYLAVAAIDAALPQIAQHAQFTFHMFEKLNIIWAVGGCGRWAKFFRFHRNQTPLINPMQIYYHKYYTPADDSDDPPVEEIPDTSTRILMMMTLKGTYGKLFTTQFRQVMEDVQKEYRRIFAEEAHNQDEPTNEDDEDSDNGDDDDVKGGDDDEGSSEEKD